MIGDILQQQHQHGGSSNQTPMQEQSGVHGDSDILLEMGHDACHSVAGGQGFRGK